jgi:hypothetical protein
MKKSLLPLISICSLCFLNGCGGGSSTPPPPPLPGATHLSVMSATASPNAGTAFSITVTALDASGQIVTSYAGAVHFTSSDGQAVLPGDSTLTNGAGTFSATLKTPGNQTITATDKVSSSISGTSSGISVSGAATHFSFSVSTPATTRKSISISVIALEASNNKATNYSGSVQFTSTDGKAILPASATLQNGIASFQVTLETPGSQTVTATDTVTPAIKGTSSAIAVTLTLPPTITSGAPPAGTVASSYGPTTIQYLVCTSYPLQASCTPCVPNTVAGCGASIPFCARDRFAPVCIREVGFVGFELTGSGGVPPYTWTATSLPPGLNIKFTSPEYLITGTPPPGSVGTYNAMITLNDSGMPPAAKTLGYAIVINNPPPPVVNSTSMIPGATLNQPFSYTLTATAGLPPYNNWTEKGALPPGINPLISAGVLFGTPTMTGTFPITVTVDDSLGQLSGAQAFSIQVYQHGFKPDGGMSAARTSHTATLLTDGTVLLAGGLGLSSAEKYDPGTGKFTPATGSLNVPRLGHTATLLKTGKVLITGGEASLVGPPHATAELFDPSTGLFTLTTNNMSIARTGHNAILLSDGKVLITGGESVGADLFDPSTGLFTPTTGNMTTARYYDTATVLTNEKVLFTGGFNGAVLTTAELYDPATEIFTATGRMTAARDSHTATLLTTAPNSGKVLIAGGTSSTAAAELYDPTIGTFSATSGMGGKRAGQTATLLGDGTVLMVGGTDFSGNVLAATELFDPNTSTFMGIGGLLTPREAHTVTLLKDGTVLVTGGVNNGPALVTAELYQ